MRAASFGQKQAGKITQCREHLYCRKDQQQHHCLIKQCYKTLPRQYCIMIKDTSFALSALAGAQQASSHMLHCNFSRMLCSLHVVGGRVAFDGLSLLPATMHPLHRVSRQHRLAASLHHGSSSHSLHSCTYARPGSYAEPVGDVAPGCLGRPHNAHHLTALHAIVPGHRVCKLDARQLGVLYLIPAPCKPLMLQPFADKYRRPACSMQTPAAYVMITRQRSLLWRCCRYHGHANFS